MAGEDRSSAQLSAPPREPLARLDRVQLETLADAVSDATWKIGLHAWFWGEGVCLLGLLRTAAARGIPVDAPVLGYLRAHAAAGISLDHVNSLAPAAAAAIAAAEAGRRDLRGVVLDCVEWLEREPFTRARNGALEHWPGGVWADTVFMAGSFLLHAGRLLEREDLVAEAVWQWIAHAEVLQHPDTGLFAHGSHRDEPVWSFWGRGNAWMALAGVELVELAAGVPGVPEVVERLRCQLGTLTECQPEHGVWDVLVDGQPENRGILETSAAAGLGAALLRAARLPLPPEEAATLERAGSLAVRGALAYVRDGVLTRVSAGTVLQLVPFGYSVIRGDRPQPWGQGLALHALAAAIDGADR
ncbi:MAG: glycoside hydrolase family 88 protein [Sporichthyaceae bacterium]